MIRTMTLVLCLALCRADALAQTDTTFTYQAELLESGAPADGAYDLQFRLWDAVTGGTQIGSTLSFNGHVVVEGRFTVQLDFGAAAFDNSGRWLQIIVNGSALSPRQPVSRSPYAIQTRGIYVNPDGHVGLGSTVASEMLTIVDQDANILLRSQGNDFGPKITLRNTASGSSTVHGSIYFDNGSQLAAIGYVDPFIGPSGLQFSDSSSPRMKIVEGGNVGIGTLDPKANLHIDGSDSSDIGFHMQGPGSAAGFIRMGSPRGHVGMSGSANNGFRRDIWFMDDGLGLFTRASVDSPFSGNGLFINDSGNVGVGTVSPLAKLHVEGNARVDVLEVVGADLAERFPMNSPEQAEPGAVLEIDPERPGSLRLAQTPYSTLVAGVVSGAKGLPAGAILGNLEGVQDGPPIALTGRVWVRCDATTGAIRPGDLLTTSGTPGHAMRVADRGRATGAVLGKAMTGLGESERGMVLVLVGLQ